MELNKQDTGHSQGKRNSHETDPGWLRCQTQQTKTLKKLLQTYLKT